MATPSHLATPLAFVDLMRWGSRAAVVTPTETLSYAELSQRVDATVERLGPERRLILVTGTNTVEFLVSYLAALRAGFPVVLAPPSGASDSLISTFDPDVIVRPGLSFTQVRDRARHQLHPELALLLSTSGSTGAPKLVRLSRANLSANATAIAGYLAIRDTDRAATTLPPFYCYGLSVIHSHLSRGAALVLTDRSVADPGFWDEFRAAEATSFAGVPHTFDVLDRIGFADLDLPHLRYVTQAGGRLAPHRVRQYAELGHRRGWDFFVMYGQTEATARMAYLPPDLALSNPGAIGVAIPGGSIRLRTVPEAPEPDTGELIYSGPNVMLGYATTPADLGDGQLSTELATGDLARRAESGLFELVGRRSDMIKLYGLRIDPRQIEAVVADLGITAACVGTDTELIVVAETPDPAAVRAHLLQTCEIPARAIRVVSVAALPRGENGKIDYLAVRELAPKSSALGVDRVGVEDLRRLFADVFDTETVTP